MRTISNFFQKNEKWLTPTALFGGFIIDNLTLRRADLLIENLLVSFYILVVLSGVLIWHKIESQEKKTISHIEFQSILFLFVQFAFGGLFSSLTVFYIKSASFLVSWPFLLLLFGGMIATEYFKKHFTQFLVQLATLYILVFTYLILIVPLLVRKINAWVFLLSGVISLIVIFGYLFAFYIIVPSLIKNKQKNIFIAIIGGIFVVINIFYFTNIIPPIPLSLRDSGVYQNIKRQNSEYSFVDFESSFSWRYLKRQYTVPSGSPVYFFSSIYAPIKFEQNVVHEWQRKNKEGDWSLVSKVGFPIIGGSDSGYRGYTISQQVRPGEWRVLVKTQGGQVLGSTNFLVKQ